MKIMKSVYLVLFFLIANSAIYSQSWTERNPIITKRWYPCSVVLDGKIYIFGGQGDINPYLSLSTAEAYNITVDSCESLTSMPTDRWAAVSAVVNNKIYVIGGEKGSFIGGFDETNVVEEYDPVLDTWASKSSMPTSRGYSGCAVINDTIFVFGGYPAFTTIEKYYPASDTWYTNAPMPSSRYTFMTAKANNKIYLIGGWGSNNVEEYDPSTKSWTTKTAMPTARGGSGIAVINDTIYVVGGRSEIANEFECYDPVSDTWTSLNPMPTAREGLTAAAYNGKLYAITGSTPVSQGGFPFYNKVEEASFQVTGIKKGLGHQPEEFHFAQNYPNPFNPKTTIKYHLPERTFVALEIYDLAGRQIKTLINQTQNPGYNYVDWDGTDSAGKEVAAGLYIYRIAIYSDKLTAGNFSINRKMLLLK